MVRALEETAPVGIVALDLSGRVTIWNRAAEQLFGWCASDVIGRPDPLIPDDQLAEDQAIVKRVLAGEVVSGIETCRVRKDGSRLTISLSSGPIRDAEGHITGTMGILTDISEAKRLTRQFLQAQKMEAFGQLAGGIAHDFNNLLGVIIGHCELALSRLRHQPEITAAVEEIRKAGERASQLTRQLLAFSRKQVWLLQVLDLNQVIGQFEKMLRRIVRENIRLDIVATPSLGHMKADPGQIEQLLMNLVVNARDAMPDGGRLTIATANVVLDREFPRGHRGAVPGRYVCLTVEDTGSGMTPDVLARAFEPFFTTKGAGKGTGLGLSTVLGLVEGSGGYITIDSAPGAGTIVSTYWPAVDDAVEGAVAPPAGLIQQGTETILLVEDEADLRHLMGKMLEWYGYTVLQAGDADAAIAIEAQYARPIHLLVSDIVMPGLSGPALAQRFVLRRPAIQVLFISGYANCEAMDRVMNSPNTSFLPKPFAIETLARKVRERLERNEETRRGAPQSDLHSVLDLGG
jgi:two-component system cell cycle sensor histidine kinase/response regulator CckA